jgi:tetratricopeptide (TPR) repeat protein
MQLTQDLMERAIRHQEAGELDRAVPLYENVLRVDPQHAAALYHLGTLEIQRSNVKAGVELLRQAAAQRPDVAEIHNNLGIACKTLEQWGEAAEAFERALNVDPNYAPAYFNLADLSQTLGQIDTATQFYLRAIKLDPDEPQAFRRLGEILFAQENWTGAEQCFCRVLAIGNLQHDRYGLLEVLSKLAMSYIKQEKLDDAAQTFRTMLDFAPEVGEMHSNLAYVYERQGKLDEALAAGLKGISAKPDYAEGHNNLGVVYRSLHRLAEAEQCFSTAVGLNSQFALAQFNLGALRLMRGDYAAGWKGYEWRNLTLSHPPRKFTVPRWDGKPIPGQTLLIHTEQGYGDTIQFARFVQAAKSRSQAQIVLEGPAALLPLLSSVAGADTIVRAGSALPDHDAEISLPSLPGVLGIEIADLPGKVPYLTVDEELRQKWAARISELVDPACRAGSCATISAADSATSRPADGTYKIGIAWRGNVAQNLDILRSCPLQEFAALKNIPGIAWFSLQKDEPGAVAPVENDGGMNLIPLAREFHDFADTAAAMHALDLIITVDTSVAHLAGALGLPVWTLLCHTPDWRYQLDRTDSAWYPTMRLFRQPRWGDWKSVLPAVEAELRRRR